MAKAEAIVSASAASPDLARTITDRERVDLVDWLRELAHSRYFTPEAQAKFARVAEMLS